MLRVNAGISAWPPRRDAGAGQDLRRGQDDRLGGPQPGRREIPLADQPSHRVAAHVRNSGGSDADALGDQIAQHYGVQSRNPLPVSNAAVTVSSVASSTEPVTSAYQAPVESRPQTSVVKTSARPSCTIHSTRLNPVSMFGVRRLWTSSCTPHAPILGRL